jgi:hypothetical protein
VNNNSIDQPAVTQDTSSANEEANNNDQDPDRPVTPTEIHVISHGSTSFDRSVVGDETPIGREPDTEKPDLDLGFARDYDILNEIPNMYRLLDIINDGSKHILFVECPNQ